jgi:uncharacterized protein (TIGR02246 family)
MGSASARTRGALRLVAFLSLGLVDLGLSEAVAQAPAPAEAEAGVRQVLADQIAAWNRGDLDAFCAVYAEDATFLSPSGVTQGRQAVLERYRKRYPDQAAMGTLALDLVEVRLAGGSERSVASVAARWSLGYPGKPAASGLTLLVLHRNGAAWQIVQDASM